MLGIKREPHPFNHISCKDTSTVSFEKLVHDLKPESDNAERMKDDES